MIGNTEVIVKYKLCKDLPDIKAGSIGYISSDFIQHLVFKSDECEELTYYSLDFVKSKRDWFSSFLFSSEDRVELFEKETAWCLVMMDYPSKAYKKGDIFDIMVHNTTHEINKINEYLKFFSTKEKAEEYLDSLKPKFKVGDIVVWKKTELVNKIIEVREEGVLLDNGITVLNAGLRLANNNEIINYYKQQGWVKGAKFKCGGDYNTVNSLCFSSLGEISVVFETTREYKELRCCELIKTLEYPKTWNDLDYNDQKANSEILSAQEIAFRRLKDLHKVFIEIYNKENNCDWKPNWNNNEDKWIITLMTNCSKLYLYVRPCTNTFYRLAFPDQFLAILFLDYHRELLEIYYEL